VLMKALRQPPQRRSIVALVEAAHFPPRARPAEPRADPFPDGAPFVRLRCPASSCPPRSFNSNAPPRRNRRRCRLQISDGDVVIGTAIRYLRVNDHAAGPDGPSTATTLRRLSIFVDVHSREMRNATAVRRGWSFRQPAVKDRPPRPQWRTRVAPHGRSSRRVRRIQSSRRAL